MTRVHVRQAFAASVHEAEESWYELERWPEWVDGLARVLEVRGPWPAAGSAVLWESGPAGRGRVTERVTGHEPLSGQTLEVEDDAIRALQWVSFTPSPEGVELEVILDYRIKRRNPLTPVIDFLFVRRLVAGSLERTVARFGAELESAQRHRGR